MVSTFELHNGETTYSAHLMGIAESMNVASTSLPTGSYTTFRTYSGDRILRLAQHVQRLIESAALLGMNGQLHLEKVQAVLATLLRQTGYSDSRFRLTFAPPRLFVSIEPFIPYPPGYYADGVKCATVSQHRLNPHAKSTTFIASSGEAYKTIAPNGIHEGLMISLEGEVLEGLSSSFFALESADTESAADSVSVRVLHTEQERALLGVTQALVLEIAKAVAPAVHQSSQGIMLSALTHVSECFITSVSREIMPVVQIDDIVIGSGYPGPFTKALISGLAALIAREAKSVFVVD